MRMMGRLTIGFLSLVALLGVAQVPQQRQQTTPPPMTQPDPVDPEIEKMQRIFDLQATEDQERKFRGMTASTELALRHARDLQRQAAASQDTVPLMHGATTLEDDIDQALTDYRIFRRSLGEQQDRELKKPMKKLITSVHAISKNAEAMSQELNRVPMNVAKVGSLAERIEKELAALHAAQVSLGREMSIPGE